MTEPIPPHILLGAYAHGVFPMAEDGEILWFCPLMRGLIPLDERFHIPKGLRRTLRKQPFEIRHNHDFEAVIRACAERSETWIDDAIIASYVKLHQLGHAHSFECWDNEGLQGGLYGVSLAWIAARGGLGNLNFDLSRIYDIRTDASDRYSVGIFGYLIKWAQKVVGTGLFALGIMKGSATLIIFALLGQIFMYGALAQKSPIAMLVFVIIAVASVRYQIRTYFLNVAIIFAISMAILIYYLGDLKPLAVLVMRTFFGPAGNNIVYFEFFSENVYMFFSTSFLRGIVEYPYQDHVFDIIAIERTGTARLNPNTGALGTGFMHMGYFGLLFYAFFIGAFLALSESLARGIPAWVPMAVMGPPVYIMYTSTDVPVALATNGGLIALVILFLWPARSESVKIRPERHGELQLEEDDRVA